MNREFLINICLLLGLNLLIKPFYIFGIERTIQNQVGTEEYGLYITLFTFTFILQIINDFGLQNFNNRAISQRNNRLDNYFSNILVLKLLLGFVFIFITFIVAWVFGYYNNSFESGVNFWFLLLFFCINHILISLNLYFRSNISGLGLYRTDSLISALDKTLLIGICSVLLWGNISSQPFQIEWFVYAQTTSLFLTATTAFIIVKKQVKKLSFNFNPRFLKGILIKSYPYALVIFFMLLYTKIDIVMIEKMLPDGENEAGIYAAAFRLLDASNMIGFLFAGLLLPMFARLVTQKEAKKELQSLVEMSFQMVWAGALTLAISVYFFQEKIMFLLYDDATEYWGVILGYLILSFVAISGGYIFGSLLTANGSMKKMNTMFLFSILINIVLNTILITFYKAEGAAIATLITQFFALFIQMWLVKTELKLNFRLKLIGKVLGFIAIFSLISYTFFIFENIDWRLRFLGSITCGISLSFLFKLINLKMLFDLLKSKKLNH